MNSTLLDFGRTALTADPMLAACSLNLSFIDNNQSIIEGLIRAMPQLTERNQLM